MVVLLQGGVSTKAIAKKMVSVYGLKGRVTSGGCGVESGMTSQSSWAQVRTAAKFRMPTFTISGYPTG